METAGEIVPEWHPGLGRYADLVVINAGELVTMAGGDGPRTGAALAEIGVRHGTALAVQGQVITAIGPQDEVLATHAGPTTTVLDAAGRAVIPGFVDCHTHLVFAGTREDEFALRLSGASYQEIMAAGGGIMNTVLATRAASVEQLRLLALRRLDTMLLSGTTTVEAKSGYGLAVEHELKQLDVAAGLAGLHPVEVVSTCLGAHTVPAEFRDGRERYLDLLVDELLPRIAAANAEAAMVRRPPLALFADAFCEQGAFSPAETRRFLKAAAHYGLRPKLHADQLSDRGGAALAAELGAISADHLEFASDSGLRAMAEAGTVAVLLPGAAFCLRHRQADAGRMIELGVPIALATDLNPGTSPIASMPLVVALACLQMDLTPAQALAAATINAAHAIGMGGRLGSLEVGKQADIVILDAPNHRHIPYRPGDRLVHTVVKRGRIVVSAGQRLD